MKTPSQTASNDSAQELAQKTTEAVGLKTEMELTGLQTQAESLAFQSKTEKVFDFSNRLRASSITPADYKNPNYKTVSQSYETVS